MPELLPFSVRIGSVRDLAVAVRDACRAAGLTQAELAAATGLARPLVSRFERGRAPRASVDKIFAVLAALDATTMLTHPVPATAGEGSEDHGEARARRAGYPAPVGRRAPWDAGGHRATV